MHCICTIAQEGARVNGGSPTSTVGPLGPSRPSEPLRAGEAGDPPHAATCGAPGTFIIGRTRPPRFRPPDERRPMPNEEQIQLVTSARVPTPTGEFQLHIYHDAQDGQDHLALVMGTIRDGDSVLTRLHSECFTGDVLHSLRCDCGEQLRRALEMIAAEGGGVLIYLRQEGRGIGLRDKLRAYNLQDEGMDTVDANLALGHQADERDYGAAARILRHLGVRSVRLLTNNPRKIDALRELDIDVVARLPLLIPATDESEAYLRTKRTRLNHWISLDPNPTPPVRRRTRDR